MARISILKIVLAISKASRITVGLLQMVVLRPEQWVEGSRELKLTSSEEPREPVPSRTTVPGTTEFALDLERAGLSRSIATTSLSPKSMGIGTLLTAVVGSVMLGALNKKPLHRCQAG